MKLGVVCKGMRSTKSGIQAGSRAMMGFYRECGGGCAINQDGWSCTCTSTSSDHAVQPMFELAFPSPSFPRLLSQDCVIGRPEQIIDPLIKLRVIEFSVSGLQYVCLSFS